MNSPRTVLWWLLGCALTVTAGEAEHVRRRAEPGLSLCLGSSLLLQGTACPAHTDASHGPL